MKINFNGISMDTKQLHALINLVELNTDFINSLTDNTYTCFVQPLGIPQNIIEEYYFEAKKENGGITITKAMLF